MTRPFVVDAALTAMAVNFTNPDASYIADEVMPRVDVGGETFSYDYFPPEEVFTVPDTTVGRRGAVPQVEFSAERREGRVLDRGLEDPIPLSDIDSAAVQRQNNRSNYDPEARAVEGLTHLVRLDREKRVAALVMATGSYDADKRVTLAGADQWSDPASDPIGDILAGMDATFIARPNIGVCSRAVMTALRKHPKIVKAVHGNDGDSGVASRQMIAQLLELDDIFVGDAFHNTAREGQAASYSRLWGSGFALIHRNRMADTRNGLPTWGFTPEWRRFGGAAMLAGRIASPNGGLQGSTIIRVGESVSEHLVAPSTGYLINAAI